MASTDTAAGFAGLLIEPAAILALPPARQAILIRRARLAGLLGVLGHRAEQAGLFPQCSAQLRDHFVAGQNVARDYERMLRLETRELYRFLGRLDFPLVYLKGAAYQLRGLPIARGRVASDVDILVPAPALEAAEQTLLRNGWVADKSDDYDQRYYREWMHELPPLRHHARLSVVDLHHNILPRTSRFSPDAGRMLARIEPAGEPGMFTLCPEDMVLHTCAHLFIDGELDNRLRELIDLDGLLRAFCAAPGFLDRLQARAGELGLQLALFYGLHFAARLPGTPVTTAALQAARAAAPRGPLRPLLLRMMARALLPELVEEHRAVRRWSTGLLFLRSHWLRMPPVLLLRHLAHQAWRRGGLKRAAEGAGG